MTEQDVDNAQLQLRETLELTPARARWGPGTAIAVAAVVALIVGIIVFRAAGGDDSSAPITQPTNPADDIEAFLSGSDPTTELVAGVWLFDNRLVRFSAAGEIRVDDRGLLLTDPAVLGTFTITGDLITVNGSGGIAGCAGEQWAMRASLPAPGTMHTVATQSGVKACTSDPNQQLTLEQLLPASSGYLAGVQPTGEELAAMQPPSGVSRLYGDWIAQDGQHLLELSAGGGYYVAAAPGDVVDRGQWSLAEDGSQLRLVSQAVSPTCAEGDRLVLGDLEYVRTTEASVLRSTTQRNECGGAWTPEAWILLPNGG